MPGRARACPAFNVVGLPDKAVGESRERVHAALAAMGLALPPKRITINLSPADLPKEGSHYDLPIALALLAAMGVTDAEQLGDWIAVGELALDGRIAPRPGVLLAAIHASEQASGLICPARAGRRGALGERGAGDRRARSGQPAQPPQGHPAPARSRRRARSRSRALGPDLQAGQGAGNRQARARDRRGGRATTC